VSRQISQEDYQLNMSAPPDGVDQVTGEAGEFKELVHGAVQESPDEVVYVTPGAERPPLPGEEDGPDPGLGAQGPEGVPELLVDLDAGGIQRSGSVSSSVTGITAVASISTVAPSSASPFTPTRAIAG